ncbi:toxin-antitoxin system HicB family antitoxin [Marispirochaeta sp.]|uniref:type II toxin-antitoxin system HicB family antitoxin n=1 Tax=Marispirochaeta sp. TaxID=2038653 RepID=UPI0029C92421|nr:toxin-antitoxin system HicB family antitoxin [Marispirochaeta sp.]
MVDLDKYTIRVEWSEEDESYIARCLEFPSLGSHGPSRLAALSEMETLLSSTLDWMEEEGERIPEPFGIRSYKGNISLRIPPETHKELTILAAEKNISLNQMITSIIERNMYYDQINQLKSDFSSKLDRLTDELDMLRTLSSELFYKQFVSTSDYANPQSYADVNTDPLVYKAGSLPEETCEDKNTLSA